MITLNYFLMSLLNRIIKQNCFNAILQTCCWCLLNKCTRWDCLAEKSYTRTCEHTTWQAHQCGRSSCRSEPKHAEQIELLDRASLSCNITTTHTHLCLNHKCYRPLVTLHWTCHLHCPVHTLLVYSPAFCCCSKIKVIKMHLHGQVIRWPSQQWLCNCVSPCRPFVEDWQPCTIDVDCAAVRRIEWTLLCDYYESNCKFMPVNWKSNL